MNFLLVLYIWTGGLYEVPHKHMVRFATMSQCAEVAMAINVRGLDEQPFMEAHCRRIDWEKDKLGEDNPR
jgi:hypothetical protein